MQQINSTDSDNAPPQLKRYKFIFTISHNMTKPRDNPNHIQLPSGHDYVDVYADFNIEAYAKLGNLYPFSQILVIKMERINTFTPKPRQSFRSAQL